MRLAVWLMTSLTFICRETRSECATQRLPGALSSSTVLTVESLSEAERRDEVPMQCIETAVNEVEMHTGLRAGIGKIATLYNLIPFRGD